MGRRSLGLDVAFGVGVGAVYVLLVLVCPVGMRGALLGLALLLALVSGALRGARCGALSGALLALTQLVLWRLGSFAPSSLPGPTSFALALLLLPSAGFSLGQLQQRLRQRRAGERERAE